jgi:uncharacterized protein
MKVIRDTVHGDIELTPEELGVIHTAEFQRLHTCRQLGLAYLVYPGAKHSRFEHVLGVMHVATRIATRLKERKQFFHDDTGDSLWKTLRFAALLHDMGHVPFGHTLEDEMPLIAKHDVPSEGKQPSRMEQSVSKVLEESGNSGFIKPVLAVLRAIDTSKSDDKLYDLVDKGEIDRQFLVLADMIGNTICADLLDYIWRDHLMTGIRAVYDDRIFQYFAVGEHRHGNGKSYPRLIIKLVKNGRVRYDCLADLLDILKLRYNLSDKVLFHPKKCAADAMLIRAMADRGQSTEDLTRYLMEHSDDGLLDGQQSKPLLAALRSRGLFKAVFVCRRRDIRSYDETHNKKGLIERLHKDTDFRHKIEKKIEAELGLPANQTSVLIFCPRPDMTLKPVRVLVQWSDGTIRRLNTIEEDDDPLTFAQVSVLQRLYPDLWKLYLFVQPELRSRGDFIRKKFAEVLKVETGLDASCDPAFAHYLEEGCMDYRIGRLLDRELDHAPSFAALSSPVKRSVRATCHERIPRDKYDEDYADRDAKTIASRVDSRGLLRQIRGIIESVIHDLKG